ncbi:MAG: twin-arginine translocase subunit TatC [Treponema sp.]|nr:twin-arginine translocase subunit TatC [Treponema sp.]
MNAPFLSHLEELRWTLLRCIIALMVCAIPCGIFWQHIYEYIALWPLHLSDPVPQIIFTAPTDAVYFIIKIALFTGTLLASPFLFFQLWHFAAPGLYQKEKAVLVPVVICSTLCFFAGIAFCYVFLPLFLRFLIGFAGGLMEPLFRVNEYFSFLIRMCLIFGMAFELPVISFVLSRMGLITPAFLIRYLRHAIVIIFIAAAILTPTVDILSQLLFGIPLVLLYGISILVSGLTVSRLLPANSS